MKTITSKTLLTLVPLLFSASYQVNSAEHELALGVGVFTGPSEFVGGESRTEVLPLVEWSYKNWFFSEYRIGSYLTHDDNWFLSSSIGPESLFTAERGNSPQLADLTELDEVYSLDLNFGLIEDWGGIELSIAQDISDGHQSYSASLSYGYQIDYGTWSLEPYVSLNYLPSKVVNYYYGVLAVDAKAGRPAYQADNGYSLGLGISGMYSFKPSHGMFVSAGYQYFSAEIYDSPLVERKDVGHFTIGYIYEF